MADTFNVEMDHSGSLPQLLEAAPQAKAGSPTLNNNMLPAVAAFLTYLKGLAPKGRVGLAFGSYGWGGQSVGQVEEVLGGCGFIMLKQVKVQYIPDHQQLDRVTEQLAEQI